MSEKSFSMGVKRFLALSLFAGLVVSALSGNPRPAMAADDAFTVNCDAGGVTSGQTFSDSVVGEDIVVTNSSTVDCVLVLATSVATAANTAEQGVADDVTGTAPNLVIEAQGVVTLTIVASGTFSIQSSGAGDDPQTFVIDSCSLSGAGVESDPWRVGSQADFQLIGDSTGTNSCTLGGHYLQTENLDSSGSGILDSYLDDRVAGVFTGTYDGDHYNISLGGTGINGWNYDGGAGFSGRTGLFAQVSGGTIKRVRIGGNIRSGSADAAGLVVLLQNGGVVSEVSSSVVIRSDNESPKIGGIVAKTGAGAARVQYSRSSANIFWDPGTPSGVTALGGIIGTLPDLTSGVEEVRDSYYRGSITIDSTDVTSSGDNVYIGGIVGQEDDGNPGLYVRTYSVGSATDSCENPSGSDVCADSSSGNLRAGALTGNNQGGTYVANFFLASGLFQAATGSGTAVASYTAANPIAVPVSSGVMESIATFQSKESGTTSGAPSGSSDLAAESDFRWAIEEISASTFVPSNYDQDGDTGGTAVEISNYQLRTSYSDTDLTKEYRTKRAGIDLTTAHGGTDPAEVTGYPALGRVWDICDEYPTLVWEERNSCSGSGGGSSSSPSTSPSTADLANAAGLTEAEYAEFLASGLTLEQFKAARLAATGPDGALLVGSGSLALLFLGVGATILVALGRERRLQRR